MRERSHRPDRKYAAIPNDAMRNPALSIEARGLLALLMTYSDHWEFKRDHLMQVAGMGKDRFGKVMGELVASGYVRVVITRTTGGHFVGKTWVICDDRTDVREIPTTADVRENRRPVEPSSGKSAPIRKPTEKKTNREEDQGDLPLDEQNVEAPREVIEAKIAEKQVEKDFERFWGAYPKCPRKTDKPKAKALFSAIVQGRHKQISITDAGRIIAGAEAYAKTDPDPAYIPLPTTWLNGARWDQFDATTRRDTGYRPAPDWYGTH